MSSIIIVLTVGLCSMYVGSYILASNIYEQTLQDFDILTTVSNRAPCVARAFFFLDYQFIPTTSSSE